MYSNLKRSNSTDEVTLCTADNTCITANGNNAKLLIVAVVTVIFCAAAYYLSKIK